MENAPACETPVVREALSQAVPSKSGVTDKIPFCFSCAPPRTVGFLFHALSPTGKEGGELVILTLPLAALQPGPL